MRSGVMESIDRRVMPWAAGAAAVATALFFTSPIGLGDFWWHLTSGRWMVGHGALPSEDPFAYTTNTVGEVRTRVILTGFWLAQVIYYLVYEALGFGGLIGLKSLVLACSFGSVFVVLRRKGLPIGLALALVLPLVLASGRYEEVRPQTFSFLFAVLLYMLGESVLESIESEGRASRAQLAITALVMVLWANTHRGFIIGYAMLFIYLIEGLLARRHALGPLLVWIGAAAMASLLNPNHVYVTWVNVSELMFADSIGTIEEYLPPFAYARLVGNMGVWYAQLSVALASGLVMLVSLRRAKARHLLMFAGFMGAGLFSFRFGIFFMLIGVAIAGEYLRDIAAPYRRQAALAAGALAIPLILAISYEAYGRTAIGRPALDETHMPSGAVAFIEANRPPGPMLNPYEWGGYLSWRLHPLGYGVFVDARTLDQEVHALYREAKGGKPSRAFERYGINTVVFYPYNMFLGDVPFITFSLLKSQAWRLVYSDRNSAIFVRDGAAHGLMPMDKGRLWDALISRYEALSNAEPTGAVHQVRLGIIHYARGDETRARECFERARGIDPGSPEAASWIQHMAEGGE